MGHNPSQAVDWSPPRLRRRRTRWLRWCLILLALFAGAYLLATRSFLTRWVVMSRIGAAVGGEASAQRVNIDPSGTFELVGLEVRAPGVAGDGGVVLACERIDGRTDFWRLMLGDVRFYSLAIARPLIRISQDADTSRLNWALLTPQAAGAGKAPSVLPQVTVHDGAIELGEHRSRESIAYATLRRIPISGVVERAPNDAGTSIITFRQGESDDAPIIQGHLSRESLALTMRGVEFQAWPPEAVPLPMRDLYQRMNLQGRVSDTTFTYDFKGGVSARLGLADVAVSLPLTERPETNGEGVPLPGQAPNDRWLRLEKVNGELAIVDNSVRATIKGLAEELPCEVSFHMEGTRADAPFTATLASRGFRMGKNPVLLRYAHGLARYRLRQFSDPTGLVDAEVTVTRAPPVNGNPGPVSVTGLVRMRDGAASFHRFPYRFEHVSGEVAFTDTRLDIRKVEGVAPTGARLHATGWISPLNNDPAMEIRVRVTGIPYDDALEAGMLHRRKALDAVFNRPRYQELLAKGLIATPAQHASAAAWLASRDEADDSVEAANARATLQRPVFELGGVSNVEVVVTREEGPESIWHDTITIEIPRAGVLPERVPLPLLGENIVIVKTDEDATVRGGLYRGLRGGTAQIEARVDLESLLDPEAIFVPEVRVEARAVPIDDLLLNAIPPTPRSLGEGRSIGDMLTRLGLEGRADIDASVALNAAGDDADYRVHVVVAGVQASPRAPDGPPRLHIRDLAGQVTIDQDRLDVTLAGDLILPDATTPRDVGDATLSAALRFPAGDDPGTTSVSAQVKGLDLAVPVEDVVGIIAPEAGGAIADLRTAHTPTGVIDLIALVEGAQSLRVTARASNARNAEFGVAPGRVRVNTERGDVVVRPGTPETPGSITFENVHARVAGDGQEDGQLTLSGAIRLDAAPDPSLAPMSVSMQGARFESGLVRAVLGAGAGERAVSLLASVSPRGRFDLDASLTPTPGAWHASGVLYPRTLMLALPGGSVTLAHVDAPIHFTHEGLACESFAARCDEGWAIRGDVALGRPSEGGMDLRAGFSVEASSLTPALKAAFPTPVLEALGSLAIDIAGPLTLEGVELAMTYPPGGGEPVVRSVGRLNATQLSGEVGAQITRARGRLDFTYDDPGAGDSILDLKAILDAFHLSGIAMTNGRVRVTGSPAGILDIPLISADCHAGRLAGTASIFPGDKDARGYTLDLRLSDVRFANVLQDLDSVPEEDASIPPDERRGLLSAGVNLRGVVGDAATRRGRGQVTVLGGRIVSMPVLMGIVRMSNLQLPLDERVDYALVDFFVDADVVLIEEASVQSRNVTIYGFGTAAWPQLDLDMRFRSRSKSRIPLISSVVEGIRDELVTIHVGGTLRKPEVGLTTLPTTSRLVRRGVGIPPSEQERRLDRIGQRLQPGGVSGEEPVKPR